MEVVRRRPVIDQMSRPPEPGQAIHEAGALCPPHKEERIFDVLFAAAVQLSSPSVSHIVPKRPEQRSGPEALVRGKGGGQAAQAGIDPFDVAPVGGVEVLAHVQVDRIISDF